MHPSFYPALLSPSPPLPSPSILGHPCLLQEASDGDPKNDELAAAAKDAARVFKELDDTKKRKAQKEADGEEGAFSRLGVHVVQNSRAAQDSNGC